LTTKFRAWGQCLDCHFEGMLEYSHIAGEAYEEVDAVMLLQYCPACETSDHAMIPFDYYEKMMLELQAYREAQAERGE